MDVLNEHLNCSRKTDFMSNKILKAESQAINPSPILERISGNNRFTPCLFVYHECVGQKIMQGLLSFRESGHKISNLKYQG